MTISYNSYPTLLYLSYNKILAPEELLFQVASLPVRDFLSKTKGFHELFSYVAVKNSIAGTNTTVNYLLNDNTFEKIDSNYYFRKEQFDNFFQTYVKPRHGVIMFKDGGQHVYLLLGKNETKLLKKIDGRYIATAHFRNNLFIGFEEGILTEKGVQVLPTGHYEAGMDHGGYLSFCMIVLASTNEKQLPIHTSNNVKEVIFEL